MRHILLPLACLLTACDPAPAKVSKLSEIELEVNVKLGNGGGVLHLFPRGPGPTCPTVDAVATMNGTTLRREWKGGMRFTVGIAQWGEQCFSPEWWLPEHIPDVPVTEFEVHDDTGRLLFGVTNLRAPRTLTWVSPESGAPRWGDVVSLQWTLPTDVVENFVSPISYVSGSRRMNQEVIGNLQLDRRDNTITFRLPDAPPDHGPTEFDGELQFFPFHVEPGTSHCEPYQDRCDAELHWPLDPGDRVSVPISIR